MDRGGWQVTVQGVKRVGHKLVTRPPPPALLPHFLSISKISRPILRVKVLVPQSCPTLPDHMNYSLSGSSVHGLLQARMLE